jgi:flavin reductase (DIM6/NTAB) family NADH-FMN oxidoreductase RutF
MERIQFDLALPQMIKKIKEGSFLIVQAGDDLNVMAIGWASFGFFWGKSVATIAVRTSRYTYEIIERAKDFSVSIPREDKSKEIEFCGTQSGRNCDKLKKCGLKIFPAIKARSPILDIAGIHIECKIVYKSPINPKWLADEYETIYPQKDFHTFYFGEVMECYSTEDEKLSTGRI